METITPFIAYVIALGIAAIIPGPGVAALVGRALARGGQSPLPFILGLALGDVLFLSVAILGLSALVATASNIFFIIKIAGGLYLLYLAWRFWTADVEKIKPMQASSEGRWASVLSGFAVTLGNPKTVVFYLALLPNIIDLGAVTFFDWSLLSLLTLVTLFATLLPYALLTSRLSAFLSSARALRRLNRGAAIMIGGAGGLIVRDAITR